MDARHDQVTALHMRMGSVRAQTGAARVPAEMMQFVGDIRHVHLTDQVAITRGFGIDVHDA
jgi:hypothetical protein